MTNIFIENQDNKFINNTIASLKHMNKSVVHAEIRSDLYRIYHHYPFDIAIFLASKLNIEVAQFISEFHKKVKCFIYHDTENDEILSIFKDAAKHLSHSHDTQGRIKIPQLINSWLFCKNKSLIRRPDSYAVFLDHIQTIPAELEDIIYPHTNLYINMFNSKVLKHHLNLGVLSEYDKVKILNSYEFFIDIHDNYGAEAESCGAKVLTLRDLPKLINKDLKITTKKTKKNKPIKSYEEFLKENIL